MSFSQLPPLLPAAIALFCLALAPAMMAQTGGDEQVFGAPPTLDRSTALTVSNAVTDTAQHNRTIMVAGTIADVCSEKGCWLVATDGTSQMRVTFKDYGFFVPKDSHGRKVFLEGVVSIKVISEAKARHYAEEAKIGPKPEEIVGPQTVTTMVATGVVIASL